MVTQKETMLAETKNEGNMREKVENNIDNRILLEKLPSIRRARGYRLYDNSGRRFLDFYQNDNAAILGHRPGKLSLYLKDSLDKGLYAEYPHLYRKRLIKHLKQAYPGYSDYRVYKNKERALDSLKGGIPSDPLFVTEQEKAPIQWGRPLLENKEVQILLPRIPFPGFCEVQPVLFKEKPDSEDDSDIISPILIHGLCRILEDLTQTIIPEEHPLFDLFDQSDKWDRKGLYLIPRYSSEEYATFFEKALKAGIFLAPSQGKASIIPLEVSKNEVKIIKSLL